MAQLKRQLFLTNKFSHLSRLIEEYVWIGKTLDLTASRELQLEQEPSGFAFMYWLISQLVPSFLL